MKTSTARGSGHQESSARSVGQLRVMTYRNRTAAGEAAGLAAAAAIRKALARQAQARVMFAAAPSQTVLLATLRSASGIEWSRVSVFDMDEYIGLRPDAPQRFGRFLTDNLFRAVTPGNVHLLQPEPDPQAECDRYTELLSEAPIDVVCLGIGENGHLAFNDPPTADFQDPNLVSVVKLTDASRTQQVSDGLFDTLQAVPSRAITVTIPTLLRGREIICTAIGRRKRRAVHDALTGPIDAICPASILRTHPACALYLDAAAALDSDRL